MSKVSASARIFGAALVSLVAVASTGAPSYAVAGGQASGAGNDAFVARLAIGEPGADGSRACTGALVAPKLVLTAKVCFAGADGTLPITATFAGPDASDRQVVRVIGVQHDSERQLTLLALARAVTGVTPVGIQTSRLAADDVVRVVGYGRTAKVWVPEGTSAGEYTVQKVGDNTVDITPKSADAALCMGDAGAPALVESGGQPRLAGIATRSGQQGCIGSSDDHSDAVLSVVNDAASRLAWLGANADQFGQITLSPKDSGGNPTADARFGAAVATGDFNKDGFRDLAVGSPRDDVAGKASGSATVFIGSANGFGPGRRLIQFNLTTPSGGHASDEAGDGFGSSLTVGDFNHDGFDDLAVGNPGEAIGTKERAGGVGIFYGKATGLDDGVGIDQSDLGMGDEPDDAFGTALAAADFNGDGFADLAVGAPGEIVSGTTAHSGMVTVIKGSTKGLVMGWTVHQANVKGANEDGDRFGAALAAGNVTGTKLADLVIGAPGEAPETDPHSGAIYVVAGAPEGRGAGFARAQKGNGGANEEGDLVGAALAVGDFDRDGYGDIVMAAPGEAPRTEPRSGVITILRGAATEVGIAESVELKHFNLPVGDGDLFSAAVATGDVNKDGYADLIVGAPGTTGGAGKAVVLLGRPRNTAGQPFTLGSVIEQRSIFGTDEPGDALGAALTLADLNGDGRAEAIVGSPGEGFPGEPNAGAVVTLQRPLGDNTTGIQR